MIRIRSPQDLGAGLLFLAIGGAGVLIGQDLAFGTARRRGPGFFPTIISALIMLIGVLVALRGIAIAGPPLERTPVRPLVMVLLSVLALGLLLTEIGLFPAALVFVLVAAHARRRPAIVETLVFGLLMTAAIVALFIFGLSKPLPLFGGA
ncbi:MAG: tripartite tricarboxylate transporter TctB family protein [Rhodospirillales bacterium]